MIDAHFHPLDLVDKAHVGVGASSTPEQWQELLSLSNPCVLGIHPWSARGDNRFYLARLCSLLTNPKVIGIGEIGLDVVKLPKDTLNEQLGLLVKQLELAQKYSLPCVFHCVRAYGHLLNILDNYPKTRGLIHSFWGSAEMAKEFIKRGFYLSLNPRLVVKDNSQEKLKKIILQIPSERLLLESDSPYGLSSPIELDNLSKMLAQILLISPEELLERHNCNLHNLFANCLSVS